jgi:Ca2+-binding RTX toxin-like protein
MSTWLEDGGGPAPLAACNSVTGTSGNDEIRIGAVYYWNSMWQAWLNSGNLGYCKHGLPNGVLTTCSSVTSPLPVKPYQGNDVVGTTSSLRVCVTKSSAIGPWSSLSAQWKPTELQVYGCAGTDYIYGTPNDDVLIGGSGTDYVYGKEGDDVICGDYGSYAMHPCVPCDSGGNCTSSGGSDTGTKMDDLGDGEDGDDTICGQDGADLLRGGEGDDTILGEKGCDYIYGHTGSDHIYAATGISGSYLNDYCASNDQNELVGGDGDDYLYGSNSRDYMWGEVWNDYTADEYDGRDELRGYGGDDKLCPGGARFGYDKAWGGGSDDLIVYYLSDYGYGDCMALGYGCDGERASKGEDGDDELWYKGINCTYYSGGQMIPCPAPPYQECMGGILLEGDGGTDCCMCEGGDGVCDIEQSPSCDYSSSLQCGTFPEDFQWGDFYCPFPYLFDYPGWSCS